MATEVSGMPNGTYAPHQTYAGIDQNNFAYANNAAAPISQSSGPPPSTSTPSNAGQPPQQDIPKDEVGWYFVEQYYTTLSRSPEKLYLFYNKRSQFVSGPETDKVAVCVGQRAINDKIRELDFHDCKVRVTNVDSQASDSNIVIQVIGELSNRGQPHRKFTQTFVLATQTNGYFVLNDIFRYLIEEEDEAEAETQQPAEAEEVQQVSGTESSFQEPASTEAEPRTLTSSADPSAIEADATEVAKEIQEKLVDTQPAEEEAAPVVNGEPAAEESQAAEEEPAAQPEPEAPAEAPRPSSADVDKAPEKPKDPEPSPARSPAKEAPPQPAPAPKPAAPAVPKTWATLAAAANKSATPATPVTPPSATPAARAPPKAAQAAPVQAATPSAPSAPSAPAAQRQDAQGSDSQDEWTAVSSSHNRQTSRSTHNVSQQDTPQHRGYIKNVNENADASKLRAELEKFGEIAYFDIARQKNCAFVDFKTADGYQKALGTPFKLDDEELFVEERRIRPGSTPYVPRGQYTGRGGARGGSGQGPSRGNFQGNRGTPNPRGRGGYTTQRGGRGGAQPA